MDIFCRGSLGWYALVTATVVIVVVASLTIYFVVIPSAVTGKPIEWRWWTMSSAITGITEEEAVALAKTYPATDNVLFKVGNIDGGGTWSATGNIKIYNEGEYSNAIETLDLDAAASATTTDLFETGDKYVVYIYNDAGTEKLWTTWEVPGKSSQDDTTIYAPMRMYTKPTYSIKVSDQGGTSYADGANWNITAYVGGAASVPGYATGIFKINIYNTADNTGFIESHDPIYGVDYNVVYLITISDTNWEKVTFSGDYDYATTRGSAAYYAGTINAEDLHRTKVGTTVEGGYAGVELTIDVQSGVADAVDIKIEIYQFSSTDYFGAHACSFGTFAYDTAADITLHVQD